jgi:hypothetical protein
MISSPTQSILSKNGNSLLYYLMQSIDTYHYYIKEETRANKRRVKLIISKKQRNNWYIFN